MALVEISDVRVGENDPQGRAWFDVNLPQPGHQADGHAFDIHGWVVGQQAAVRRIEILCGHYVVRRTEVGIPRPDVMEYMDKVLSKGSWLYRVTRRLPGRRYFMRLIRASARSGFQACVSTLGLPAEFELQVRAVLKGGTKVPLAKIRGRHAPVRVAYQPRRQPIVVTHTGRSGSTWLMHLLAEHPDVVVHRKYPFESCTAVHTIRMVQVLTTPTNPVRQIDLQGMHRRYLEGVSSLPVYCHTDDPRMHAWIRREYTERFAAFGVETIDAFYDELAQSLGKPQARFFAEKMFEHPLVAPICMELYPAAKEVFLVRDFRDVTCSRYAFHGRTKRAANASALEHVQRTGRAVNRVLDNWRKRSARSHLVRYEDLVLQPMETLQRLFRYLEIDGSTGLIKTLLERTTRETPELERHRTSKDSLQSVGRWKSELEPSLLQICNDLCGDALQEFGYTKAA